RDGGLLWAGSELRPYSGGGIVGGPAAIERTEPDPRHEFALNLRDPERPAVRRMLGEPPTRAFNRDGLGVGGRGAAGDRGVVNGHDRGQISFGRETDDHAPDSSKD